MQSEGNQLGKLRHLGTHCPPGLKMQREEKTMFPNHVAGWSLEEGLPIGALAPEGWVLPEEGAEEDRSTGRSPLLPFLLSSRPLLVPPTGTPTRSQRQRAPVRKGCCRSQLRVGGIWGRRTEQRETQSPGWGHITGRRGNNWTLSIFILSWCSLNNSAVPIWSEKLTKLWVDYN